MKYSIEQFLNKFCATSLALSERRAEVLDYWHPDEPPLTTLFSELGWALVDDVLADAQLITESFVLIEQCMCADDVELKTAVATGLVESVVAASDKSQELWSKVKLLLGPSSLSHAESWRSWGR